MIAIKVTGIPEVRRMLQDAPKHASRAVEMALDKTAKQIAVAVRDDMRRVFSSPVPYTLNSLKVQQTRGHNMTAIVGFKEPERMGQHYLVPQVEGGQRKSKGFEMAAGSGKQFDLGAGAKRTAAGNITVGQAKAIVSGVKRKGEYVIIKPGNKQGLKPGVYQRFKTGTGFSKATTRTMSYLAQKGRRKGRFASAIRARGLKPILIETISKRVYRRKLDFYGIAKKVYEQEFEMIFRANFERLTGTGS